MMSPQSVIGHNNLSVFLRSIVLVGVAELFDKTWFMGLLMALKYDKATVFMGSFIALFLHCFLAAACGLAFARLLPQHVLHYFAAGLFALFACLYAWDWYHADPDGDAIASGKEDAEDSVNIENTQDVESTQDVEDGAHEGHTSSADDKDKVDVNVPADGHPIESRTPGNKKGYGAVVLRTKSGPSKWIVFGKCFIAVFIAEWGDRTQFAMIGQHASQPLIPVFMGSVVAFFLLTLSAVIVAHFIRNQRLSERLVHGVGAVAFLLFSLLSFRDALDDHAAVSS